MLQWWIDHKGLRTGLDVMALFAISVGGVPAGGEQDLSGASTRQEHQTNAEVAGRFGRDAATTSLEVLANTSAG